VTVRQNRFDLKGKVAVILGGGGHICSTLSQALSEVGVSVVALDQMEEPDAETGSVPPWESYLRCNVTSKAELIECRKTILENFGRIDILLNGAGVNAPTPFFDVSEDEFQLIIDVNLKAVLLSCQVFGETMVSQECGSIINFASVSAGPPLSKAFVYSVAKAGVYNLTQNLAREWARNNVRVNALRPGFYPTEWSMRHFIDEDRQIKILSHTPMGRFGSPDELVGAVLWLASDDASFVTGALITIDGGFSAMTI